MCLARLPLASRAVRGSAVRGLLAALFAVFFSLSFPIRDAFATYATDAFGTAIYGPVTVEWEGEEHTEVGYVAPNRFDAAAYAIGYTKTDIQNWGSAEGGLDNLAIRGKLSNASTGGAFYELAMSFMEPTADDWVPTDAGPSPGFWAWAYTIYGEGNLWYCSDMSESQKQSARSVVESILGGGSGGSGGSGGLVGDSDTLYYCYSNDIQTRKYSITDSYEEELLAEFHQHNISGDSYWVIVQNDYMSNPLAFVTYINKDDFDLVLNEYGWPIGLHNKTSQSITTANIQVNGTWSNGTYTITSKNNRYGYVEFTVNANSDYILGSRYYWSNIPTGIGGDDESDNNWPEPDTPVTPNPPDPNPPSPVGPTAPTLPKPTNPTQPVNVTVTVTTPVDDILNALNKIIQELENHCVHLQNKMVECSKYIGEYLGQVRDSILDAFDTNADFNARLHDDLMSYLEELFGWMRDNLNFDLTVTNSGDSDDIVDWLKRIYVQDGTGYSNSRPIDITQNYEGYGSWVHGVVGYLLPDLTDTSLAPVNAAFDALDDKFPFSVPNDILRIFQSFESNAVAPVMTFTIPSVLGIGSYSYRIDLSPYDSAMSTIRAMELVAFVTFLLVWARRALTTEAVGADD